MIPSLPVSVTVKPVSAGFVPPNTMQGLLVTIPQYLDIELEDSGPTISVGATAPTDTTGLWIQVRPAPEPPEAEVFVGTNWTPIDTGNPNEVRIFVGNPNTYFDGTGNALGDGDWHGWALCNGGNNTLDLTNKFVVPGYRYNASLKRWITNIGTQLDVGGGQTGSIGGSNNQGGLTPTDMDHGGFSAFQINLWNLPTLTILISNDRRYSVTPPGTVQSIYSSSGVAGAVTFPLNNQAQMVQTAISRLPPYIAVGYVQFVGFA